MTCPWEPLVAENAVTELLAIDLSDLQRQTFPVTVVDQERNLYKPSAIAAWLNDCDRRLRR